MNMLPRIDSKVLLLFHIMIGFFGVHSTQNYVLQNIAVGKPVEQMSTGNHPPLPLGTEWVPGYARLATDGIKTPEVEQTCTRTKPETWPWIMVDLQDNYLIREVALTSAHSSLEMKQFVIEVSPFWNNANRTMVDPQLCYRQDASMDRGDREVFPCYQGSIMARYIRVTKRKSGNKLSLCEVEVYGIKTMRFYGLEVHRGYRSESEPFRTTSARSVLLCSAQCRLFPDCTSFNVEKATRTCELTNNTMLRGTNILLRAGWDHYIILHNI